MRIGLIRPDRIGDCVLASCAIRDVRDARPDAEIFWIVREAVAPLFAGRDFPATRLAFRDDEPAEKLAEKLVVLRLDAVAHLNPHPPAQRAAALAGIQVRAGIGRDDDSSLTRAINLDKDAGRIHEVDAGRLILATIPGFRLPENAPRLPVVSPADDALAELDAHGVPTDCAAFHPAAHGGKTRPPHRIFIEAAAHLRRFRPGLPITLIGERPAPGDLPAGFAPGVLDLRGKLSLAASAHLLRRAALVLSRDSGPAHLAAALGAPTVCVFLENIPAMSPTRWEPCGPRVAVVTTPVTPRPYERLHYAAYRRRAAEAVSPQTVNAAISGLLA